MLSQGAHPLARVCAVHFSLARPLAELQSPPNFTALLQPAAPAPLERSEPVREAIRAMLRSGGYKPTGRGKPASEYLLRAATEGQLASINPLVDLLNAVSLHSGLPLSTVDTERAPAPWSIPAGVPGESYIFNSAGQSIDLEGLLCLCDAAGPCANPVKDAQRTKTHAATRSALTVIWGAREHVGVLHSVRDWYLALLRQLPAEILECSGDDEH